MIGMVALALAAQGAPTPKSAQEAVALADAHRGRRITGVYRVTIAAAARSAEGVFLNSAQDYRAPDALTVELTMPAAPEQAKRLGAKPETVLVGRTVIVRGAVEAVPIVNLFAGRPRSFNRYQHRILVRDPVQMTVE